MALLYIWFVSSLSTLCMVLSRCQVLILMYLCIWGCTRDLNLMGTPLIMLPHQPNGSAVSKPQELPQIWLADTNPSANSKSKCRRGWGESPFDAGLAPVRIVPRFEELTADKLGKAGKVWSFRLKWPLLLGWSREKKGTLVVKGHQEPRHSGSCV